jgi:hypothetical protein
VICGAATAGVSWRNALASKTHFPIALLVPSKAKADGFKTILVYCVGPPNGPQCWHWSAVKLEDLPDWDRADIYAHFKCTKCGSVGWVDPRPNWGEVINFNKGVS